MADPRLEALGLESFEKAVPLTNLPSTPRAGGGGDDISFEGAAAAASAAVGEKVPIRLHHIGEDSAREPALVNSVAELREVAIEQSNTKSLPYARLVWKAGRRELHNDENLPPADSVVVVVKSSKEITGGGRRKHRRRRRRTQKRGGRHNKRSRRRRRRRRTRRRRRRRRRRTRRRR